MAGDPVRLSAACWGLPCGLAEAWAVLREDYVYPVASSGQIRFGEDLNYVEAVKKPLETVLKCLAREINASESRIRFDLNARRGSGTTEIEPSRVLR